MGRVCDHRCFETRILGDGRMGTPFVRAAYLALWSREGYCTYHDVNTIGSDRANFFGALNGEKIFHIVIWIYRKLPPDRSFRYHNGKTTEEKEFHLSFHLPNASRF